MYIPLNDIIAIQLDHTSRCNLLCPQCARTNNNGDKVNPRLHMADLTINDYELIFSEFKGKNINIVHCGNYGDIIASPTFDSTHKWCVSNGFNNITIMTNGSARPAQWWRDLAVTDPYVIFSVDGLNDTNHLYRVNSNFDKILSNMKEFISAGGRARWDFIVFDHNYHQVNDAKIIAQSIGVREFNIKNTTRFITPAGYSNTIINRHKQTINDKKDNIVLNNIQSIKKEYSSFNDYIYNTPITCKYKNMRRYFVDFELRVWPCCWIGGPYLFQTEDQQAKDINALFSKYGKDFNKLDLHGWEKILNHEFYKFDLENSWLSSKTRIYTCGKLCGNKIETSSGFGKNTIIEKLQ